jgi:phage host-nuclease inhibitor protein Gam
MAGRPKKASIVLTSMDDCTATMAGLLVAVTELEKLVATRDQAVAAASARYEVDIDSWRAKKADLELALRNYYMAHVEEMEHGGRKSVQLPNGVMGRRLSPPKLTLLNRAWTWAASLVKLRSKYGERFLRTRDPEIDKDLVKAELDEAGLKEVGLAIDQDEVFFAEPARLPEL